MQTREDKIIREKLQSLQDLPEGYQPNLESKWSVLESGLTQSDKKKGVVIRILAIAAALLIPLMSAYFFVLNEPVSTSSKQVPIMASGSPEKTAEQPEPAVAVEHKSVNEVKTEQAVVVVREESIHVAGLVPEKTVEAKPEMKQKTPLKPEPVTELAEEDIAFEDIERKQEVEPTSSAKHRYFRMDFNDDVPAQPEPPDKKALAFEFSFGGMRSGPSQKTEDHSPESPLKITR